MVLIMRVRYSDQAGPAESTTRVGFSLRLVRKEIVYSLLCNVVCTPGGMHLPVSGNPARDQHSGSRAELQGADTPR